MLDNPQKVAEAIPDFQVGTDVARLLARPDDFLKCEFHDLNESPSITEHCDYRPDISPDRRNATPSRIVCWRIQNHFTNVASIKSSRTSNFLRSTNSIRSERPNIQTLVFCSSLRSANHIAELLVNRLPASNNATKHFSEWLSEHYHPDWVVPKALECGVGVHHGKLPRSIAQQMVRYFDEGKMKILLCTSTLIEGVNTKAKNEVVYDNKIANKKIDHFTFNNIKGRSGRMFQHFIGNVYLFDPPPQQTLPFVDFPFVTQGEDVPTDLLVEIELDDLSKESQERMQPVFDQTDLPLSVIKMNEGIDPFWQIELAQAIANDPATMSANLSWSGFPTSPQTSKACLRFFL